MTPCSLWLGSEGQGFLSSHAKEAVLEDWTSQDSEAHLKNVAYAAGNLVPLVEKYLEWTGVNVKVELNSRDLLKRKDSWSLLSSVVRNIVKVKMKRLLNSERGGGNPRPVNLCS